VNTITIGITRDSLTLETPYAAATSETEAVIARIWSDTFGISGIGIDDDFFDLGGDSSIAVTITSKIAEAFGHRIKAGALVQASTVRQISELLTDKFRPSYPSHIVPLRSDGNRPPLFIVHGLAGFLFPSAAFLSGFHADQPVYSFQVPGYDGQQEPLDTVEDIADEYLRCMKLVSPDGPWNIAGFCNGSWIAFEMASKLRAEGKRPSSLTIIDPDVQRGRMRVDYDRIKGARAPLAAIVSELKIGFVSMRESYRCYRKTGKWFDPAHPTAHEIPEYLELIKESSRRIQLDAIEKGQAFASERKREETRTPTAIQASSRLLLAFHRYSPKTPIDMHVHLISSEFLNKKLNDPLHPIRRLMPDLSISVLGRCHLDTVSTDSSANSCIMQRVVDEASQENQNSRNPDHQACKLTQRDHGFQSTTPVFRPPGPV